MHKTPLTMAVQEIIDLKLSVLDEFIEDVIEPLGEIGNPEKLIGKPYEQWTLYDLQILGQIYGPEPNALSELIFKKAYEEVKTLEKEV